MTDKIETPSDVGKDDKAIVTRWLRELKYSEDHEKEWREVAGKVITKYRDERKRAEGESTDTRFNILYSNTEVLRGSLYSNTPVPDVRRRYLDKDPIGKQAARVLQRGLAYSIDSYDFDDVMASGVEDMLLPGRGVARVKYVPTFAPMQRKVPVQTMAAGTFPEGVQRDPMGMTYRVETVNEVVYEEVLCDYVEWDMFRYSPAKRWSKVRWVAFGELLTKDDLEKNFGKDIAEKVSLNWAPNGMDKDDEETQLFKRALVWTIWNKTDRKVYVVSAGYTEAPLKVQDDPLRLERFFPCPRPIYDIKTTSSLVPVPDYTIYQDHAIQLDEITERISILISALRRRGVYDASNEKLADLAKAGDNTFIPVENYTQFAEKGGLKEAWQELDISNLAKVIMELRAQAEQKKQDIYEIIGIADIMRGATDSQETLGAQQIKNQWGSIRLSTRQKEVQRFARDLLRLKAEIIAEHFSVNTLADMTGIQMPQQAWVEVMKVLKSDKLRGFRVNIETDSTIQPNADQEQKNRTELLTAVTGFIKEVGPAVQTGAMPMKVATELMMFGVRGFKVGPELEETLDAWAQESQGGQEGGQADPAKAQQEMEMQKQAQHADQLRTVELETAKAKMVKEKALAYQEITKGEAMLPGTQMQELSAELGINGNHLPAGPAAGSLAQ